MKRGAQAWVLDIFLGVGVFLFAFAFLIESYGSIESDSHVLEDMSINAKMISEMLLSEGIPADWNSTDVIQPGLLTGGRINTSKVDELDAMDYDEVRSIFRIRYNYLIAFEYSSGVTIRTIGPPGLTLDNMVDLDPDNVLRMNRLTVFEGSPVKMVVVLWE